MKFKVGAKLIVKNVYSGGNFANGDIVTVSQIGCDDEPDCYGAVSPHDGFVWYLYEDEVGPATNADRLRSMSDEELAVFQAKRYAEAIFREKADNGVPVSETAKKALVEQLYQVWLQYFQQPVEEGTV